MPSMLENVINNLGVRIIIIIINNWLYYWGVMYVDEVVLARAFQLL